MPIYEYVCKACGHEMDALQKMADAPLTDCEACGAPELKRKISAPSFRLKGQGWYETDFKTDKDKKRNLADAPSGSGGKSTDGKSEIGKSGGDKSSDSTSKSTSSSSDGGKAA